jgi:hypothetical protein
MRVKTEFTSSHAYVHVSTSLNMAHGRESDVSKVVPELNTQAETTIHTGRKHEC